MVDRRTILVTGGAGFLGSHLCDRLLAAGHDVLCVDNFFTGTKRTSRICSRIARFELMRHDVTFPLYVEVDQIYNLACPASPIHYQYDPVQTTKTSVHGAINMLGLAKRVKRANLPGFDFGSLRRPGDPPADRGLLGQRQPDRAALLLRRRQALRRDAVLRLSAAARLEIKVVRIFNTYGPRMHPNDGRVVSNFIVQALKGEDDHDLRRRQPDPLVLLCDDLIDGLSG